MTFAAAQANALKGAGSHVFAIGIGAADAAGLASITGGTAGTDVGTADYSIGNSSAVADGLNALATAGTSPCTSTIFFGASFFTYSTIDSREAWALN